MYIGIVLTIIACIGWLSLMVYAIIFNLKRGDLVIGLGLIPIVAGLYYIFLQIVVSNMR